MRHKIRYKVADRSVEKEVVYIPIRYILAILLSVLEIIAIIGAVVTICLRSPLFFLLAYLIQMACVIRIIASDDNPDYKVPWLLFVLILPIGGFMLYFLFYSRKLKRKFVRRMKELKDQSYEKEDENLLISLQSRHPAAAAQAKMLMDIAETHLFTNTVQTYYPSGEEMWRAMLEDLRQAQRFIFMEYFIIEQGVFWNSILEILKQKAAEGVAVRVVYDDIGCMTTLPGAYHRTLASFGIIATPFSRLKGQADSEFNNRSHRKILVIDGKVGYTGGINLADEYINRKERFGHWKDTALRLEGEAVWELTRLFLIDYGINVRQMPQIKEECFPVMDSIEEKGYLIPFGDGPHPIYPRRVGKSVIQNLLHSANRYVYMTTPYLIIDNDLCSSIENAALRGVDVRIIVPHIPDKKLVFSMTRSFYHRLIRAGVRIYEYAPGFIHAKSYLADDELGMIGTINLDYRSLVHHFENGVWMYQCAALQDIKKDMLATMNQSILIEEGSLKTTLLQRFICSVVRIFAPLL